MKTIIVHVGPHKTGSSAIQKCLLRNESYLASRGVLFLHNKETHQAAMALAGEKFEEAEERLERIVHSIDQSPYDTIVLSQEDFCGALPGRSMSRRVYPKLTKNLRIIRRVMRRHKVLFLFFLRNEQEWLRSCYAQSLKHRTTFFRYEDFEARFGIDFSWEERLQKPGEVFGKEIFVCAYDKSADNGVTEVLKVAGVHAADLVFPPDPLMNVSPGPDTLKRLEHINRVSEFTATAWFAKKLLMDEWRPARAYSGTNDLKEWPPAPSDANGCALPALNKRTSVRVPTQSVTDVMPDRNVDLADLSEQILPQEVSLPDVSRQRMEDQVRILEYHLRGKTRLAHLNAVVISYLRRDTAYTSKARFLFHRIWEEQAAMLINELSTRWLISTLQTFLDHGKNEAQRQIGTAGYFYANMMKIYEGERSIEGRPQDGTYEQGVPQTPNRFRGLDRFNVGGTDLMLNTNALALEIAQKDDVAGVVLQEFLLRVKSAETAFSRLDRARIDLSIETPNFLDTWSFFEKPK